MVWDETPGMKPFIRFPDYGHLVAASGRDRRAACG